MPSYTTNVQLSSVPPGNRLIPIGVTTETLAVDAATDAAIDAAVAAANMASFVAQGQIEVDLAKQSGVDVTGATDCGTAVQTALDAASAAGKRVFARGTVKTSTTLTIKNAADLEGLTVNYTGSGIAVQVGDPAGQTFRRTIRLPHIIAANKSGTGWGTVAGTVGVRISNCYSCEIHVPRVNNFETGILGHGAASNGASYNNIFLGHLDNNKVNFQAAPASTGWFNQNTFYGGRMSHDSSEGTGVAGTRHCLISTATSLPNSNVWYGTSLESPNVVEYVIESSGLGNLWDMCRFEYTTGTPNVKWNSGAARNTIRYGFNVDAIVETVDPAAGVSNVIIGWGMSKMRGSSSTALALWENDSSSSTPVDLIMAAGAFTAGTTPSTGYCVSRSALLSGYKRSTDSFNRVEIDHSAGTIGFSFGTGAPAATEKMSAGSDGASIGFGGGIRCNTDNASDVGAFTTSRFRNATFSGGVATGTRTVTATGALSNNDGTVFANNASSATLTLPTATSLPGRVIRIRSIAAGTVTVASAGGNVDGGSTVSIAAGAKNSFQSDGTNWWSV